MHLLHENALKSNIKSISYGIHHFTVNKWREEIYHAYSYAIWYHEKNTEKFGLFRARNKLLSWSNLRRMPKMRKYDKDRCVKWPWTLENKWHNFQLLKVRVCSQIWKWNWNCAGKEMSILFKSGSMNGKELRIKDPTTSNNRSQWLFSIATDYLIIHSSILSQALF